MMSPECAFVFELVRKRLVDMGCARLDMGFSVVVPFIEAYDRSFAMWFEPRGDDCLLRFAYEWFGHRKVDGPDVPWNTLPRGADWEFRIRLKGQLLWWLLWPAMTNLALRGKLYRSAPGCPTAHRL